MPVRVFLVCATRASPDQFQSSTALGISLARVGYDSRLVLLAATANTRGLPQVYNDTLSDVDEDVIGLCGNGRRMPGQAAWCFVNCDLDWDDYAHLRRGVAFDPRFDFYDLDFCRTARKQGMTLGTWPICLTHQSAGKYGSDRWRAAYGAYIAKWGS